jgi:hypothetical protein
VRTTPVGRSDAMPTKSSGAQKPRRQCRHDIDTQPPVVPARPLAFFNTIFPIGKIVFFYSKIQLVIITTIKTNTLMICIMGVFANFI